MIIVFKKGARKKEIDKVIKALESLGLKAHISKGIEITIIGAIGDVSDIPKESIEVLPGVEKVLSVSKPYKLVSRQFHPANTKIKIRDVEFGGDEFIVIAGPCAIENEKFMLATAKAVKDAGAKIVRGSAYKPRTSPYSFQGLGEEGLKLLKKVKEETGLPVETELMDARNAELVAKYVDVIRIGARNMQNFDLLKEVGKINKPIILKRGISATVEELLLAAEYIMAEGNEQVILCERGIRTFETATRNTLDISAIPIIKKLSHLPVIVDPSHASGKRDLIKPLSLAAAAAGADGLIVEVHCNPEKALCDGKQSLTTEGFADMMKEIKKVATAVGKKM